MRQTFSRQLFALLFVASVIGTSLVAVRFFASGRFNYFNLVWNLFLAWIPVVFSMLAWKCKSSRAALFFCGFFWLLFFPNSPYLVTDLIHLRERPPVPFWFDLVLVQSFVLLGLALGFVSLHKMQSLVANLCGYRASWIFVIIALGLTGFGIYLGRVQRWNSWDLLVNPLALLTDIFHLFFQPHRRTVGIYSLLHAGFLLVAYGSLCSFTRFNLEENSHSNRAAT